MIHYSTVVTIQRTPSDVLAALLDAEYRAFDGLDDDDADLLGFDLDSVAPPHAGGENADAEDLLEQMTMKLPPRQ